jgi:NitT/TauT family transport system substrate-binding protein
VTTVDRRRFLGLLGAGAASTALWGCGGRGSPSTAGGSKATTAATAAPVSGTVSVAGGGDDLAVATAYWQRFAPTGLKVETRTLPGSSDMTAAMDQGTLDFAVLDAYGGLVAKQAGRGSKVICLCSRKGTGLVVRTDRNINSLADLRGRTVAVAPASVQSLVLAALVKSAGLAVGADVRSVPLAEAAQPGALQKGDVDAYLGIEPYVSASVVAGVGRRLGDPYATPIGDLGTAVWASPKMLFQPDLLTAAARMQRDAAEYLSPGGENDRAAWHDLLVTRLGHSEQVYEEALPDVGAAWRFDDGRRRQLEAAAAAMRSAGVLDKDPDYENGVYALGYQPAG